MNKALQTYCISHIVKYFRVFSKTHIKKSDKTQPEDKFILVAISNDITNAIYIPVFMILIQIGKLASGRQVHINLSSVKSMSRLWELSSVAVELYMFPF